HELRRHRPSPRFIPQGRQVAAGSSTRAVARRAGAVPENGRTSGTDRGVCRRANACRRRRKMNHVDTSGPDELDLLTAYLDGELSDDARWRSERRLAEDPALHHRFVRLQQAWAMLEDLPQPQASPQLTESTLTMVAQRQRSRWRPFRRPVLCLAASCLVGLG